MFKNMRAWAMAAASVGLGCVGGVSAAHAGTVVVTSGGNITATAPSMRFVVGGVALNCTGHSMTATLGDGTYTGASPLTITSNVGISFSSCTVAGIPYNFSCAPPANLRVTGNTVSGTTAAQVDMIRCVISLPLIGCTALFQGQVSGSFNNVGAFRVFTVGQALSFSNSTCPSIIPNGAAQIGGTGAGSTGLTDLSYSLGAVKPQLNASGF